MTFEEAATIGYALEKVKLPRERVRRIAAGMVVRSPGFQWLHAEYQTALQDIIAGHTFMAGAELVTVRATWDISLAYRMAAGPLYRVLNSAIIATPFQKLVSYARIKKDFAYLDEAWAFLKTHDDLMEDIGARIMIQSVAE